MKTCPQCNQLFDDNVLHCPHDGAALASAQTLPPTDRFTASSDPMIGKLIAGRFQILSKLGEGGMGAVYKAEHSKMNRLCAIKIMSSAISSDKDALARFNREAQMSSKLDHPHAVTIYDFGEAENGLVYLAMEFIEGEMLSTVLKREGVMSVERTLEIARQAGGALDAAHKLNIIHRDLKPDNIMIAKKGGKDWVKVLDFGIAKVATDDHRHDLTQAGMVVGTPLYMSPEQLAGEKLDARSDLYSFALIIYQMLTGALPFKGENTQAVMIKRLTEAPLPIQLVNPNVRIPGDLESAILQALARDRNHRPQTVTALLTALESGASQTANMAPPLGMAPTVGYVPTPPTNPFPAPEAYRTAGGQVISTGQPALGRNPTPGQFVPPPTVAAPMMNTPGQPMPPQPPRPSGMAPTMVGPQGMPVNTPGQPLPQMNTPGQPMPQPGLMPGGFTGPQAGPSGPVAAPPRPPQQSIGGPPPVQAKKSSAGLIIGIIVVIFVLGGVGLIGLIALSSSSGSNVSSTDDKGKTGDAKVGDKKDGKGDPSKDGNSKSSLSNSDSEAQSSYDDGVKLMQKKNYSGAEEQFRKAIKAKPDFADAHYNLGVALFNNYKLDECLDELKQAIRLSDTDERKHKAFYARGLTNWEMKKYEQAADDFSEAFKYNTNNHEQIAYRGFVLQLAGRTSEARAAYENYLALENIGELPKMVKQCLNGEAIPPATLKEGNFNPLE